MSLNDRIRELSLQAATTSDANLPRILSRLQTALYKQAEKTQDAAIRQATRQIARRTSELVAKVETEQDPQKYSEIVEELNRLLESEVPVRKPPTRAPVVLGCVALRKTQDNAAPHTPRSIGQPVGARQSLLR
jgi:hypothetical protein